MSNKTENKDIKSNQFNKEMTTLEQDSLAYQIQNFLGEKSVPVYVKFKLTELLNKLLPTIENYQKLTQEVIKRLGNGKDIPPRIKSDKDPKELMTNPVFTQYREEVKPIEEERKGIKFEKLPLSSIMKIELGGYPMVFELFYEDANATKAFQKLMEEGEPVAEEK